ncbi:MAG: methionyl-tRNA synthetase [Thermoleophilaceae bacterium]|jgi:methionyl-tRNA synthetase|nr:methionyl-tRNA synthetase [Thermoleophilaceae bacterium]
MSYYVTTPIYYVNGDPHLGHAYTTIAADVLARHMRQRDEDVFFLTGTDEHGEPVTQEAEKLGITPRELGDRNAVRFKELAAKLNATNDFFIRTTDPEHMAKVAEVVQRIHDNGHVYAGTYEGWYCPRCADFKTESELEDGNRCPIHQIVLEIEKEDNWFFRLSTFQEPLERLYAEHPEFVTPQNRYNEALSFIKGGLRDLSLSRARLKWGVPVPWDPTQVIYVWIDALLNYYTALSYAREGEDLTERFWPADVHLIGKDILKFHAVIWPAMLMAADIEVPRRVGIHGYLLLGEHKMSKSLGNVIEPFQVVDMYGPDALRFYVLREVSYGSDGEVSAEGFETRYTTELANEYGNLASRTLAMISRYREGVVPEAEPAPALKAEFDGLADAVMKRLDEIELTGALDEIWQRIKLLNRYVQEEQPWQLSKDEAEREHLDQVLYSAAEGLRVVSVLLHPFMPTSSERLLAALGREDLSLDDARLGAVGGGASINELGQLFPRVEPPEQTAA